MTILPGGSSSSCENSLEGMLDVFGGSPTEGSPTNTTLENTWRYSHTEHLWFRTARDPASALGESGIGKLYFRFLLVLFFFEKV